MTDLTKLIAAVETGADWQSQVNVFGRTSNRDARNAYHGSLDAAKRLHDALLPGWIWNVVDSEVTVWPGHPGDPRNHQDGYCEGNPARAWLLAILRAIKAKD